MKRNGSYWNGVALVRHMIFDTEEEATQALSLIKPEKDDPDYYAVTAYNSGDGYVIEAREKDGNHFVGLL